MEILNNCPVCDAKDFSHFLACVDHTVSRETFKIVKCDHCGLKFTNPRPSAEDIGPYYQSEEYISHSNTSKGLINGLYQLARKYTLRKKHSIIKTYSSGLNILDYGSGTGEVLNYLSNSGYNTTGIEPDEKARKFAIEEYGLTVLPLFELETLPKNKYDIITMWHVLEHVHLLKPTVQTLCNCLNSSGILIVAVPNPGSADAEMYREYWAAYDVPRHLYHFEKQNVIDLMAPFGLTFLESLPMKLDSFYVSLLSEKYKSGGGLIKPFLNGLQSNIKASKSHQYSSRIYIFKKK